MELNVLNFNAYRRGAFIGLALAVLGLGGCADNSAKQQQPGASASSDASPGSSKARISKMCMLEPAKYFGEGNATNQSRCDCYADGVTKRLSKDQLNYLATYNEVPFNAVDEYDGIKQRCISGAPDTGPEKKPAKKKAASSDKS